MFRIKDPLPKVLNLHIFLSVDGAGMISFWGEFSINWILVESWFNFTVMSLILPVALFTPERIKFKNSRSGLAPSSSSDVSSKHFAIKWVFNNICDNLPFKSSYLNHQRRF